MLNDIILKYPEVLKKSCIPKNPNIFKELLENKKYKNVVEIGTGSGLSTCMISAFVSHVYTFDVRVKNYVRDLFWDMKIKNITRVISRTEIYPFIETLDFDFAFIDGDHTGEAPRLDFEAVKKCGRVLFHDINRPAVKALLYELQNVEIIGEMAYWRSHE